MVGKGEGTKNHWRPQTLATSRRCMMKEVVADPAAANAKGVRARATMQSSFTPEKVGQLTLERLRIIRKKLEEDGAL